MSTRVATARPDTATKNARSSRAARGLVMAVAVLAAAFVAVRARAHVGDVRLRRRRGPYLAGSTAPTAFGFTFSGEHANSAPRSYRGFSEAARAKRAAPGSTAGSTSSSATSPAERRGNRSVRDSPDPAASSRRQPRTGRRLHPPALTHPLERSTEAARLSLIHRTITGDTSLCSRENGVREPVGRPMPTRSAVRNTSATASPTRHA